MAWVGRHPVAAVVEELAHQQCVPGSVGWTDVPSLCRSSPGLHRVEQVAVEDRRVLAGQTLAFVDDLADVEAVAQQIGERAAVNGMPPTAPPLAPLAAPW